MASRPLLLIEGAVGSFNGKKFNFFCVASSGCSRVVLGDLGSQSDPLKSRCYPAGALFGPDLESCPFRKSGDLLIFQSDHRPNVAFFVFLYSRFSRSLPRSAAIGIGRTVSSPLMNNL